MPHVVVGSCCADASCVVACPVNCIHPAPGEPGFAEAEMVYVDPATCVDCGACVTACPADAIVPETVLRPEQRPFLAVNAEYYDTFPHADRAPVAQVPPQRRLRRTGPFQVAVVGAGPAGMYVADALLRHPEISVDVIDRLPMPYGLVRYGVAPDHPATKQVAELFAAIEAQPGFRYLLGVEVGTALTHRDLAEAYDAVVYSVGAAHDRPLGLPGEELDGSHSATDLVAWYNGHPDQADLAVRLEHERAVVVGNGNVALDVARVLTRDPDLLASGDIAALPLEQLRRSQLREVVVLGRRGPAQAAFTVPELIGLAGLPGLDVVVDDGGLGFGDDLRGRLLADLADRPRRPGARTLVLRFGVSPIELLAADDGRPGQVGAVLVGRNRLVTDADGRTRAEATGETERIEAGLVVRAVGYRGRPIPGLPFDSVSGTVPHSEGRVEPGVYVAGWVKRGPSGFIGTNKSDAEETVETLLDDLDAGTLPRRGAGDPAAVVRRAVPGVIDRAGWWAIDAEERRRGALQGRTRAKVVDRVEAHRIAEAATWARTDRWRRRVG